MNAINKVDIKHKRLIIIGKHQQAINKQSLLQLLHICQQYKFKVILEEKTAFYNELNNDFYANNFSVEGNIKLEDINENTPVDFVIVIGGDGTMLGVARELCLHGIPLIGVNSGRLGFITDINLHDINLHIAPILQGHYNLEYRLVLEASIKRNSEEVFHALAINDVVVSRTGASGMVELAINVDGNYMCKQRADGLIVATPTGSTAYALSVGGSILHPQVGAVLLAPIAPQGLSNRPIIIPSSSNICIKICGDKPCVVNFDMQNYESLQIEDEIHIYESKYKTIFVHHPYYNYYDMLRRKLHWQDF
jgi:NAD+ kinase